MSSDGMGVGRSTGKAAGNGPRSRAGRLPTVRTLDLSITRPWRFKNRRFRAGLKLYSLFGASAERDIQTNVTSPFYGTAYNPVERSIGFVIAFVISEVRPTIWRRPIHPLTGLAIWACVTLKDFSARGVLAQVKLSTELAQRYMTVRDAVRKTWSNLLRLRRKRVHIRVEPKVLR